MIKWLCGGSAKNTLISRLFCIVAKRENDRALALLPTLLPEALDAEPFDLAMRFCGV